MRTSWRLTKWRGVPIVLHWTVLLGLPWLFLRQRNPLDVPAAFLAFLFLMLCHELGHAAVAKWRRVRVLEIRLYFIHGLCRHEEPDRETDAVWIAWGGVAAQGVVLVLAFGLKELLMWRAYPVYQDLASIFRLLIKANLLIMLFNLTPVPPFDGARAWRALPLLWQRMPKPSVRRWRRERQLRQQSKEVAADIIERLRKRQ